jgi:hypothetical protein
MDTFDDRSATLPKRGWWFRVLATTAVVLTASLVAGAIWIDHTALKPHRIGRQIEEQIESLAKRRPPKMTKEQWTSAVAWTLNLHGNSLISFQCDSATLGNFRDRLAERLAGPVDMTTILWIWDEYALVCPGGAKYQRFRPMMLEEIEAGGGGWTGINVP